MDRQNRFIVASLPAALIGAVLLGGRIGGEDGAAPDLWRLAVLERLGIAGSSPDLLTAFALGAAVWLPLLLVALMTSRFWAEVFARTRGRSLDGGWLMSAWLYALLLPASVPLGYAALGLSFGLIFGCHLFGGTGRYPVSPALLAVVFLGIAYPPYFEAQTGNIGSGSALACFAGAAWLIMMRAAAWQIVVASVLGAALVGTVGGELPWHAQLLGGSLPFAIAFIATDPSVQPLTRVGLWGYGALFGLLTVVIRVADPAQPEGTWQALLLASLCVPLLDVVGRTRAAGRTASAERER